MSVRPPKVRYEGEDKSVMASILARRMVAGFDGTTTKSLLPTVGTVNLVRSAPASASTADSAPDAEPPSVERRSGLKVKAYTGVADTQRPDQPAPREGGMRISKSRMTIRKRSLV